MVAFYDLSEAERIALTQRAITEGRTVMERWSALAIEESGQWNQRSALAAGLLEGLSVVADLGCGQMSLEHHLPEGSRYVPVDVVARDERTVVVDLNREPPPDIEVDAWVALGLLEYVFDVPRLLAQLNGVLVTSYNPTDLCPDNRLAHAWVNAYSIAELEGVFERAGWTVTNRLSLGSQCIWKLTR
jgi:Hypothetical methyltransferase